MAEPIKVEVLKSIYSFLTSFFNQEKIAKSTALATSLIISSTPATLYKLVVYNDSSSAQYIQLHNAASLPSDTAVPVITFNVASKGIVELPIHNIKGLKFSTGIVACNSSTAATKTIGSADCWFHAIYN